MAEIKSFLNMAVFVVGKSELFEGLFSVSSSLLASRSATESCSCISMDDLLLPPCIQRVEWQNVLLRKS